MELYRILNDYPVLSFRGSARTEITSLVFDSRRVLRSSLFVCLVGAEQNGHDYIREAIERQAAAIVIQEDLSPDLCAELKKTEPVPAIIKVADSRLALAFLSRNFYPYAKSQIELNLIVGESGKTALAQMFYYFARARQRSAALMSSMQLELDDQQHFITRTHPEASETAALLSEIADRGESCQAYLPLSYQDMSLRRGSFLEADTLTCLQGETEQMALLGPLLYESGMVFINVDAHPPGFLDGLPFLRAKSLRFGIETVADIRARDLKIEAKGCVTGTRFTVDLPDGTNESFFVALPGRQNVYNALALICRVYHLKEDFAELRDYLAQARLSGRTEFVRVPSLPTLPFTVLIDSAWTDKQMDRLLNGLRPYCRRRMIVVAGAGGDRAAKSRSSLGEVTSRLADFSVFTVTNPRSEGAESILNDLLADLPESGRLYALEADRIQAIRLAMSEAEPGDLVLITGRGDENYCIDAQETILHSDYDLAVEMYKDLLGDAEGEKEETDVDADGAALVDEDALADADADGDGL